MMKSVKVTSKMFFGMALALGAASSMVACGDSSGGKVQIGVAKRSEAAEKLFQCSNSRAPKTAHTVVGSKAIAVCRVSADGKITAAEIMPRFYAASKGGVMRLAQLFGTEIQYEGKVPESQVKLEIENEVNLFLKNTCAPQIERVFKRSSLDLRLAFRSYRENDRLSSATSRGVTGSQATSNEDILGVGGAKSEPGDKEKDTVKTRDTSDLTGILKLTFGIDQGITIRDEVGAVSSGPLKSVKTEDEENKLAFCAQLLMRVSENLGVAAGRDCESREKAQKTSPVAPEGSTPVAKSGVAKSGKAIIIGLTKSDGFKPSDVKNLKLADEEVFGIVQPICGDLMAKPAQQKLEEKTPAKTEKTETK